MHKPRLFAALLERLTLQSKLVLGFGTVLVFAVVLGIQGLLVQQQFSRDFELLQAKEVVGVSRAKEAEIQLGHMVLALHKAGEARDEAAREALLGELEASRSQLRLATRQLRTTIMQRENDERLGEFEALLTRIDAIASEAADLIRLGLLDEARVFIDGGVLEDVTRRADRLMGAIAATKELNADVASRDIRTFVTRQTTLSIALLVGDSGSRCCRPGSSGAPSGVRPRGFAGRSRPSPSASSTRRFRTPTCPTKPATSRGRWRSSATTCSARAPRWRPARPSCCGPGWWPRKPRARRAISSRT